MNALGAALDAMRGRRAVVVGDLMLDSYVFGETVRVSREAPVIVVRKEHTEHRLGGASNTAVNLTALGVQTELVGLTGQDEAARTLREMLEKGGADASRLRPSSVTTPVKTRVLAGAFGTSRQQVVRLDDEPAGQVPPELARAVAADLEARAASAEVVVVSDYGLGVVSPPVVEAARRLAEQGHTVCVDSRHRLERFAGVSVVKPNVPEAEAIMEIEITSDADAARAARGVVEQLACHACLLTRGRGGMTLVTAEGRVSHVEIVGEKEVTDVTGAGDTVVATLGAALAADLGLENGMRLANCAAGVVVTKLGTAAAEPAEIEAVATRHGVELVPWGG